ncbi:hypothetical protein [Paracoccus rhizosphaerae]|uniref:Uncharacterized protein n=1 Tax=Paracoccus rhizosphaerae TaxID=1133347 RepID=A0ABV6CKV2_9RHOB|nr:hypothetical protein [Paracoccus rhizosphaerae]
MKRAIAACWLGLATLSPLPVLAAEAGDAVFAERGPWDLGDDRLDYRMTVEGPAAEGFSPTADGALILAEGVDPSDGQPVLELTQTTESRDRKIGPFPISGGDPVLTFFLEQTARDMATLTGGSPHYIRNRMKDALFRGGEIAHDGDVTTATFHPFEEDPNAERMNGFQSLTLTFVMGDPTDPIRELRADTGDTPGYRNELVLE